MGLTRTELRDWRDRTPVVARLRGLLRDDTELEPLAARARQLTRQYFGRTMRLFAPLYLSNECINNCAYCGFSRDNPIWRVTLGADEVEREARHLAQEGFRNILLVAGEHPKFVSGGYLEECVRRAGKYAPSVSIEVGPMEREEYEPMVRAGAEGLVVYQETYDADVYAQVHTAGPKKDFDWRLACAERGYEAGFRRLGVGALLGLADWREEALWLGAHVDWLLRRCWKSQITVSFPRLRPAAGEYEPRTKVTDTDFVRLVCAFRVCFPQVGLVLSTREPAKLRDGLMPLGITLASAGSHTEPGGYTHAGVERLHRTERGRVKDFAGTKITGATGQFAISDERSAAEMAECLRGMGLDPVWKDWDRSLGEIHHEGHEVRQN